MTDHLDQENDMTSPPQLRHDELVALLTEIRDRLPEPEGVNAVEPAPADVEDERIEAWHRVAGHPFFRGCYAQERPLIDAMLDLLTLAATSAETVHSHGPAQGQGRDCSERTDGHGHMRGMCMASAPADDGLAEWERELLRPATCCGKCPPIAGGGYDCTCEGNPRCEKADTPEEWHAEPAPDAVTISLPRDDLTKPTVLRLAAADLRRKYHLGMGGLPRSLPGTLDALADALDHAGYTTPRYLPRDPNQETR